MPSFAGVTVDGRPARLVASDDPTRVRFLPGLGGLDVEFVATRRSRVRVPPLRARARRADRRTTSTTAARSKPATSGSWSSDDGTLSSRSADRTYHGLFGIEDCGRSRRLLRRDPDPSATCRATRHRASARGTRRASQRLRVAARARPRSARSRSRRASRRACRSCGARSSLDNRRPITACACAFPTGAPVDDLRRGDHVRHRSAFDRAGRRRGLGAPRAAHVPASGLDRGERTRRRRARPPRGRGHARRRRPRHARAQRRRARAHRVADPPDAGRTRDDGARRADRRASSRDRHARAARRRTHAPPRSASRGVLGGDDAAPRRRARRCSSSTPGRRVLSACKPAQ